MDAPVVSYKEKISPINRYIYIDIYILYITFSLYPFSIINYGGLEPLDRAGRGIARLNREIFKGSDRLCMVAKLIMQYCGQIL